MRISDFLKGLNEPEVKTTVVEEVNPQELTPAQQSINTQVVQADPIDPLTPENEKTGETVGDPSSIETAAKAIETSPGAENGMTPTEPTPTPDSESVDLSKGAEDQESAEHEQQEQGGENDSDDSGSMATGTTNSDGGEPNPVDQADQDMEKQQQQYEESVTEKSFAEQFAATLAEGTQFKIEMKLDGLFESQGFEAEFASQAKEIFEAAVNDAAKQHLTHVNQYAAYVMENMLAEKMDEVESCVDEKLNEAVAVWVESNRLAIEQGVRTQVAESFMGKLKNLLVEHYVEIPSAKKDLYEEKAAEVDSLKTQLSEAEVATNQQVATLTEEVRSLRKQVAIDSFVRGMSLMQADRIRSLAEGISYDTEEKFVGKLKILRESYVNKPKSSNADTLVEDITPVIEEAKVEAPQGDPVILALAKKIRT